MSVVTFPQRVRQELPYRCWACGADRGCDCDAPAVEKLATQRQRQREADARYSAKRKAKRNQQAVDIDTKASKTPQRVSDDDEDNPPPDRRDDPADVVAKTRRMPDRRSIEDDEADDPSPENMASPAGLRNLIKWVNDTTGSVGRWHKIIKGLASRRLDDEEWDELRKTLKLLRRRVNAALSAIDVARPAVDNTEEYSSPETKKEKEEDLRDLVYDRLLRSGLPTIILHAPRYLSNQFYLEIFEEFLSKRKNLQ